MPPGPAFGRPEDRLRMVEGAAACSVPCGRPSTAFRGPPPPSAMGEEPPVQASRRVYAPIASAISATKRARSSVTKST